MSDLLDELAEMLAEDLDVLGTQAEFETLREILETGTSADRQRAVYEEATEKNQPAGEAVVRHLIQEFHQDL